MSRSFCLRKWVVGVVMVISQVEMCESQLYTIRRIADESKPACETVRIGFRVIRRLKDSTALNFSLVRVITSRHIYTQACGLMIQSVVCKLTGVGYVNTRSSATAEKQRVSCPHGGRGLGPPAHSPPPPLATPMRMVESETRNKRTSSVPYTKRTLR